MANARGAAPAFARTRSVLLVSAISVAFAVFEYFRALEDGHFAVEVLAGRVDALVDLVVAYGVWIAVVGGVLVVLPRDSARPPDRTSAAFPAASAVGLLTLGYGLDRVGRDWAHSPFSPEAWLLAAAVCCVALGIGLAVYFGLRKRRVALPPVAVLGWMHLLLVVALLLLAFTWPVRDADSDSDSSPDASDVVPERPDVLPPPRAGDETGAVGGPTPPGDAGANAGDAGEPPNVILVSIDTARADAFGLYGHPESISPNFDRIAAEGARFTRAFSQDNWTLPSHASMFTSLYPPSHGVEDLDSVLDPRHRTLAELLRGHGYRTGAFVDGDPDGFVGARRGFARGFGQYVHYPDGRSPAQIFLPARLWADVAVFFEKGHADDLVTTAIRWIELAPDGDAETANAGTRRAGGGDRTGAINGTRNGTRGVADNGPSHANGSGGTAPFFLFLHVYDVHASWGARWPLHRLPYTGHSPYYEEVAGEPVPNADTYVREGRSGARFLVGINRELRRGRPVSELLREDDVRRLRRLYDSGVFFVDQALGRLDRFLHAHGLAENTILIVTSDHGESFLEHGEFLHDQEYWHTLQVPLVVRWPAQIEPGRSLDDTAELIDLAPTILGLTDLPVPRAFQGVDLAPALIGADDGVGFDEGAARDGVVASGDRAELVTRFRPAFHANRNDGIYGVRTGAFSYLVRRRRAEAAGRIGPERTADRRRPLREELYDLRVDPRETHNVLTERPALLQAARDLLVPFIATQDSLALLFDERQSSNRRELDQRTRELLRSLGYIDE